MRDKQDFLKDTGLSDDKTARMAEEAKIVIPMFRRVMELLFEDSKHHSVKCPYCSKEFVADTSDKVGKRLITLKDQTEGYEIVDVDFEETG
jgi:hypothetical protein